MAKELTAAQRNVAFQHATRQNWQMLPTHHVNRGASTVRIDFPKTRFLTKVLIDFEARVNITHATETDAPTDDFTPYKLIRNLSLNLNNGWSPYSIGGRQLALYNAIRLHPSIVFPQSSNPGGYCYCPQLKASADGASNTMRFTVELPITLNDRDTIGIILLQVADMVATMEISIANGNELVDDAEGYTVEIEDIEIRPMWESFSVPVTPEAFPDISTIKLVQSRTESFTGGGFNIIRIPTGHVYRKIGLYITDEAGKPLEDDDYTGEISLVFNQTDTNYSLDHRNLRHLNELQLGYNLPKGCYVFDFSNNGVPNYGGTRDLIDATALTELWIRFPTSKAGRCHAVLEQLSKLA